jgi:hypothetical protein
MERDAAVQCLDAVTTARPDIMTMDVHAEKPMLELRLP